MSNVEECIDVTPTEALIFLFAVAVLALTAGPLTAQLITGVTESGTGLDPVAVSYTGQTFDHPEEGAGFTVPALDEDVPSFTDRNHEYNGVSAAESIASLGLVGVEYIMSANDNREVADYKLDITVADTVDAYVFMDKRVTQPQWLIDDGWAFLAQQGSHLRCCRSTHRLTESRLAQLLNLAPRFWKPCVDAGCLALRPAVVCA